MLKQKKNWIFQLASSAYFILIILLKSLEHNVQLFKVFSMLKWRIDGGYLAAKGGKLLFNAI